MRFQSAPGVRSWVPRIRTGVQNGTPFAPSAPSRGQTGSGPEPLPRGTKLAERGCMHILLGTIVGAGFAAIVVIGLALFRGEAPALRLVLLAALGGGIAGAITTATLGAGSAATAGIGRQVVAFSGGGAGGGTAERVAENLSAERELGDGLATAAGIGGSVGFVSLGASKAIQAGSARYFPRGSSDAPESLFERLLTTKTSGTGHGIRRALQQEEDPPQATRSPLSERRERRGRGTRRRHWRNLRRRIGSLERRHGRIRHKRVASAPSALGPPPQAASLGVAQALASTQPKP